MIRTDGKPTIAWADPPSDPEYDQEPPTCPGCWAGTGAFLGQLGRLEWYRCIDCGLNFSRRIEELPDPARSA